MAEPGLGVRKGKGFLKTEGVLDWPIERLRGRKTYGFSEEIKVQPGPGWCGSGGGSVAPCTERS